MYKVYVKTDSRFLVTSVNSDAFLPDIGGWALIDEGDGIRYQHAQGNYLPKPIVTGDGIYRYKLDGANIIERTAEEIQADRDLIPPPPPSLEEVRGVTELVFRTLAQTGVVTPAQVLEHQVIFPLWKDNIGKQGVAGAYYRHDGLFRVKQAHILSLEWIPGVATAALFERIQPEGEIEDWQPGQSYAQGVHVMHSGFEWESMVANNIWEPGGAGVYENIWKKVIG